MTTDNTLDADAQWFAPETPEGPIVEAEGEAPYDIKDVGEPIHDEVYQASVMERLDGIEEAIRDLIATVNATDQKLTDTLMTVDRTLSEVQPFLDGLGKSKVGRMLGLGAEEEPVVGSQDEKPRTKRGFF